MSIREDFEERERRFMSPHGCLSSRSRGRVRPEPLRSIRTAFQLDRDRIVFSNAFRRMKYKTQVFLSPLGDQYRTRLTHTLEVAHIARTIARAMYLNEDLAEAIALGHDLGHTPFGHGGETALTAAAMKPVVIRRLSIGGVHIGIKGFQPPDEGGRNVRGRGHGISFNAVIREGWGKTTGNRGSWRTGRSCWQ